MPTASPVPGRTLLSPGDHVLMMVDHQSQMAFAATSIDAANLRNNAALIARAAREFDVITILTAISEKTFSGPLFDEIRKIFGDSDVIERTNMNPWEVARITDLVNAFDKSRIVLAGLWTSVCITGAALSALDQGFEVYIITDACGDVSAEAHERALQRMMQAGARPITSLQYLLELQRDWARAGTYDRTVKTAIAHGGNYGLGLIYATTLGG